MSPATFGLIAAIASPFFSSIATVFKSGAVKSLTPLIVVGVGGILGSLVLFILSRILGEDFSLKKIKLYWKDFTLIIILRMLLGELFFTVGLSQTSVIKAIFFTKIEPYFVLFLAWFFLKEKVYPRHVLFLAVHLSGALLLSTGGIFNIAGKAQMGDLLIIIAMAFFASTYTVGKRLTGKVGAVSSNAVAMAAASFIILPLVFLITPPVNYIHETKGWIYLVIYVFLFNVIALTLWYASLKTVRGWIVSALRYLGPVFGAPVAYVLFGETLNLTQIIGATIIITTSFLIAKEHFKQKEPQTEEL